MFYFAHLSKNEFRLLYTYCIRDALKLEKMVDHTSQLPVLLGHLGEVARLMQPVKDEHQDLVTANAEVHTDNL